MCCQTIGELINILHHLISGRIYDWGAIQVENDLRGLTSDDIFYSCKEISNMVSNCDINLKYGYQVENGNVSIKGYSHPKAYRFGNCHRFSVNLILAEKRQ